MSGAWKWGLNLGDLLVVQYSSNSSELVEVLNLKRKEGEVR